MTIEKVQQRLRKKFWELQENYRLLEPGDKVMVCLSGGKDSYTLLDMMLHLKMVWKNNLDIVAVNLDQKQPGFPEHVLPEYLNKLGVNYKIVQKDTYTVVKEKTKEGDTLCTLCSRLRRGILYDVAEELGVNKIALGHHREDVLETFLLNLFFSGKLESMPAKYKTDDGRHVVIRPLAFCAEADIVNYALHRNFPIIPCNLCGSQENMQRRNLKNMMAAWEEQYPDRKEVMMNALTRIHLSHLYDKNLYDFDGFFSKIMQESKS